MFASLKLTSLTLILIFLVCVKSAKVKSRIGPGGMSFDDTTNCSEFSKYGRFNPYSVLYEKWFVFYYWAPPKPLTTYIFTIPTANHTKHLRKLLNGNTILPVMWSARQLLMEDQNNETSLLVERGDRGEYWWYPLYKVNKNQEHKISPRDVRLKQTGDNRLLGYMDCVDESLMVMSKINDVPPKNRLQEEASRLGYRGRRGKSYLYQGHEWVPIPEDDEKNYWYYKKDQKEPEKSSKETNISEQSSEEVESQPTKKQEGSKKEKRKDKNSEVTFNEEEVQGRCTRIEPELWNDPKPDSAKDLENRMITKQELNSLDTTVLDNTQYILDTTDSVSNNKPENKVSKESENAQENNNLDNHQDEPKKIQPLNEQKNEKPASAKQTNEEDCDMCLELTSDPYIPENFLSIMKSDNNEPSSPKAPVEPITPQEFNSSSESVITLSPQTVDDLGS